MSQNKNPYKRGRYQAAFANMMKMRTFTLSAVAADLKNLGSKNPKASAGVLTGPTEKSLGNFSARGDVYFCARMKKVEGEERKLRLMWRKEPLLRKVYDRASGKVSTVDMAKVAAAKAAKAAAKPAVKATSKVKAPKAVKPAVKKTVKPAKVAVKKPVAVEAVKTSPAVVKAVIAPVAAVEKVAVAPVAPVASPVEAKVEAKVEPTPAPAVATPAPAVAVETKETKETPTV